MRQRAKRFTGPLHWKSEHWNSFRISDFGFRVCFGFRISNFGFPTLLFLAALALAAPPPTPQSAATPAAREESFTLELIRDRSGDVVRMPNLLALLDHLFPGAVASRWNPLDEILHIEAKGRAFDLLARRPVVLVDGTMNVLARPIMLRQGEIRIPVESVALVLRTLGVEFEINAPTPTPASSPTPVTIGTPPTLPATSVTPQPAVSLGGVPLGATSATLPLPATQPSPTPPPVVTAPTPVDPTLLAATATPQPTATESGAVNAVSTGPVTAITAASQTLAAAATPPPLVTLPTRTEETTMPMPVLAQSSFLGGPGAALEPPPALAGRIGLSWGQLADLVHREPPSRLTIVCDGTLEDLARDAAERAQNDAGIVATVLVAPSARRDGEYLASRLVESRPDLLVDVMAGPPAIAEAAADGAGGEVGGAPAFQVWVVHEFLWPRELAGGALAPDPATQRYRRHEFQSLALGSLLRGELGHQFPDRVVLYDLAPLVLLAGTDAPSAAVLVPVGADRKVEPSSVERISRAVAAAVTDYVRGMRRVQF